MAGWRQAMELSFSEEDVSRLSMVARSRTEPARSDRTSANAARLSGRTTFLRCRTGRGSAPSNRAALRRTSTLTIYRWTCYRVGATHPPSRLWLSLFQTIRSALHLVLSGGVFRSEPRRPRCLLADLLGLSLVMGSLPGCASSEPSRISRGLGARLKHSCASSLFIPIGSQWLLQ